MRMTDDHPLQDGGMQGDVSGKTAPPLQRLIINYLYE